MSQCERDPECTRGFGHYDNYPCGGAFHVPGNPCQFCGKATPMNGDPCWDCWTPITVADFKGIMAEAGIDTVYNPDEGSHETA